ncbi:MAG: ATP-binding protein, partial [Phycisphaerales bacterium JB039]
WVMTHKIFLRPVHDLREAAERVRAGDLGARANVQTGDEFEQLGETFNAMLEELQTNEAKLRSINAQLDVRLSELSQANVALFETARLKGEFLANVSHELRTPLNSIIGFAELLVDIARAEAERGGAGPEHGKRMRYLENIVSAGRSLLELINSLLEMAKLEAGRIEVRAEAVSLKEVCEGMVGLIHPQAQRRGVTVLTEIEPDAPIVETDLKKLQQILFNLLSNAVKFSGSAEEAGRVTLRAERLRAADDDERVRISVLDNGPGIDPADQARIFDKFQQADNSHTRAAGGAGLGLSISRQLAGVLQGEIQLVSDPGRGSMFSLILPLKLDPELAEEIRIEAEYRAGVRRPDWGRHGASDPQQASAPAEAPAT